MFVRRAIERHQRKPTPPPEIELHSLLEYAKEVGCPADQMENFLSVGYVPQPKQLEFHAACRECDEEGGPDQVAFGGSRGPGKSHAAMAQTALDDCRRYPGLKVLYLRKVSKQAREQFEDLRRSVLNRVPHTYSRTGIVEFPNGSRIHIGHFKDEKDVDNYLGIEYDLMVIEETTTLSSTKYQALRDSNRTGKLGWRPRIYNTTNPGNVGHAWYKARFVDPYRADAEQWTRFIPATIDDNKFIDRDYRRKLEENTGWRLRAYRYGDWDVAAGQFFVTWRYGVHVVEPFEEIPKDWPKWACLDYGFAHPTVMYLLAEDNERNRYVIDEHWVRYALPPEHSKQFKAMLARYDLTVEDIWPVAAGSDVFARRGDTSGKTIAEQYADEGIYLSQADVDRINGAAEVLRMLGNPESDPPVPPKLFVSERCRKLIECIPILRHNPNRPEDVLKVDVDDDGFGGDDPYDALRYGLMAKGVGAEPSTVIEASDPLEYYDRKVSEWEREYA